MRCHLGILSYLFFRFFFPWAGARQGAQFYASKLLGDATRCHQRRPSAACSLCSLRHDVAFQSSDALLLAGGPSDSRARRLLKRGPTRNRGGSPQQRRIIIGAFVCFSDLKASRRMERAFVLSISTGSAPSFSLRLHLHPAVLAFRTPVPVPANRLRHSPHPHLARGNAERKGFISFRKYVC